MIPTLYLCRQIETYDPFLRKQTWKKRDQNLEKCKLSALPPMGHIDRGFPAQSCPFVLDTGFYPQHDPLCGMFPLQAGLLQGRVYT